MDQAEDYATIKTVFIGPGNSQLLFDISTIFFSHSKGTFSHLDYSDP